MDCSRIGGLQGQPNLVGHAIFELHQVHFINDARGSSYIRKRIKAPALCCRNEKTLAFSEAQELSTY
jgi:hypothetical protein